MVQESTSEQSLWGLGPADLHARFWASRGIQVVVPDKSVELVPQAELYLLLHPDTLAIFRPARILDEISWLDPKLTNIRLVDPRQSGYREDVETTDDGGFVRFSRVYRGVDHRVARVALTPDREIAKIWQLASDTHTARALFLQRVPRAERYTCKIEGRVFNASDPLERALFLQELMATWTRPDATIRQLREVTPGVWAHASSTIDRPGACVGPLWIGAGREVKDGTTAVGPSVMWDKPEARPPRDTVEWMELEALDGKSEEFVPQIPPFSAMVKRGFDIVFSILAILLTLPVYPIVALLTWLEDGLPIFYFHKRETIHAREFGCMKFRSMRNDADEITQRLKAENKADGPQFFLDPDKDPRLTKIGKVLRKYQIDELPQFFNSLKGDMSIVGPRPSPYKENQFSPPWRETRLSVRPGITGLWQVRRTRQEDEDFKEWIKYDMEYVEKQSLWFDLYIIYKTVEMMVRGFTRR
ncbi:MAG: sugar transferase [Phycisphaerales bacterium]|nr:MAG: sugar transferase [Phycisphaerales bacterium]